MRGVDQGAGRHGIGRRPETREMDHGTVDRRQVIADEQMLFGATVMVVRFDRLLVDIVIRDVEGSIARHGVDSLAIMVVVMIVGGDFDVGDAGELHRMFDLVLGADRTKALQRDHQGHG